jgi:hypothetical protein
MSIFTDPKRIPENYGIRIAVGVIAYFLLMKFAGFFHIVELRMLNLVILVAGIYLALRKFKQTHQEHLNYFRALVVGVATGAVGSVLFAVFLFLYVALIDTDFMLWLQQNEPMGRFLNPYIVAFIVALEGVFSGLLVTFVLINYIQTDEPSEAS